MTVKSTSSVNPPLRVTVPVNDVVLPCRVTADAGLRLSPIDPEEFPPLLALLLPSVPGNMLLEPQAHSSTRKAADCNGAVGCVVVMTMR